MEWLRPEYKGKLEEYRNAVELGCLMGYGNQHIDEECEDEWEDWVDDEFFGEQENKNITQEKEIKEIANIKCPSMMMWNYPASIYRTFLKYLY